jgi:hypothetical protein
MREHRFKPRRLVWCVPAVLPVLWAAAVLVAQPATRPAATNGKDLGPDVVLMKELEDLYEPVPFDHKSHARMAEMWNGCVTCHHRSPEVMAGPAAAPPERRTQDASAEIPACKSCHKPANGHSIKMPGLKGAYHRQCLNCHKDWAHANGCGICHKPKRPNGNPDAPTPDDITGRMHPPAPEPDVTTYRARFTPAAGPNVTFRHKEHTQYFGLKCAACHHRDSCSDCHDASATRRNAVKPIRHSKDWAESHQPCYSCHKQDRCTHCHYKDGEKPPAAFDHAAFTGQAFDADHAKLACYQCHEQIKSRQFTCNTAGCHEAGKTYAYPAQRPGPVAATRPAAKPPPATRPAAAPRKPRPPGTGV